MNNKKKLNAYMSSDARITVNGHIFAAFFHYVVKIYFFIASVESFLLYRSESWTLTTAPEKQLDSCCTRPVADPGEGPWGAGPPSPQGLDGRAPLLKVRLDPALKAASYCSKHKPGRSYI